MIGPQIESALLLLFVTAYDWTLFLVPGLAVAAACLVKRQANAVLLVALILSASAAAGYLAFWAFFFNKLAGKLFCFAVYAAALTVLIAFRRSWPAIWRFCGQPFLYAAVGGFCYLCLFFLFVDPAHSGATHANVRFFDDVRPGDNLIPMMLGDRIYAHGPLRPFCCGDWLSSDRPPLQAGVFLLERPLRAAGGNDLNYEVLGAGLQMVWVCGVWSLLAALGSKRSAQAQVIGLLLFCGFFFYNSVYTWPKLMAGGLLLMAISLALAAWRERRVLSTGECAIGALCLGSALMAHPGCVFSLPAFFLFGLRFRGLFTWRGLAIGGCLLLAFQLPWSAYQKYVDPPGNRLLKMHLAGQQSIDARTTLESVRDAYRARSVSGILRLKWSNLALLAGEHHWGGPPAEWRIAQREWIANALGVLNLGWICGALAVIWKGFRARGVPHAGWLLAASVFNFFVWSLVVFGPAATVTTHSSYADILMVGVGLAAFLIELPRAIYLVLLALEAAQLWTVWVWTHPALFREYDHVQTPVLQAPLLVTGVALLLGLGVHFALTACRAAPIARD